MSEYSAKVEDLILSISNPQQYLFKDGDGDVGKGWAMVDHRRLELLFLLFGGSDRPLGATDYPPAAKIFRKIQIK